MKRRTFFGAIAGLFCLPRWKQRHLTAEEVAEIYDCPLWFARKVLERDEQLERDGVYGAPAYTTINKQTIQKIASWDGKDKYLGIVKLMPPEWYVIQTLAKRGDWENSI